MKHPTVTVHAAWQDDERVSFNEGLPDLGTYALVPLPEGERMVVVVTEGGEWQGAVRTVEKAMLENPGREPLAVLDALAEEGGG